MRNIKTSLKISSIMILISLILSISIVYYLKLDKPVFLKSYQDIEVMQNDLNYLNTYYDIEIKYIANSEDKRKVSSIVFKEAPELYFYVSENNPIGVVQFYDYSNDNISNYGRYGIHTVFLNLSLQSSVYDLDEDIILKEATIRFDDGLTMDVDLGKLVLYKYDLSKEKINDEILHEQGREISTNGISKSGFYVNKYIQVSDVYSKSFEYTRDLIDFNINKTGELEDQNLIYNANDNLYFTCKVKDIDDPEKKLYGYNIKPNIYFKDRSGKEYTKRINTINYKPNFNFNDIYKYLKKMGDI